MKKSLIASVVLLGSLVIFSSVASADSTTDLSRGMGNLADLITTFNKTIVKALGTLFLSMGVVAFFVGVVQYIWGIREGDSTKATNGKSFMIWGLVGLFVMFSVYGIIKVAQGFVPGLDQTTITIPSINIEGGSVGSPSPNTSTGGSLPVGSPTSNTPTGTSDTSRAIGAQCTLASQCASGYCQTGPYGSQCAVPTTPMDNQERGSN